MKSDRYSVIIQWSDEDRAYVVTLPEWGGCHTHGATYEEAAKNASEVLQMLIEAEEQAGRDLPPPHGFMYPGPSGFTYELSSSTPSPGNGTGRHVEIESLTDSLKAEPNSKAKKGIRAKLRRAGHYGGSRTPARPVTKEQAAKFAKR